MRKLSKKIINMAIVSILLTSSVAPSFAEKYNPNNSLTSLWKKDLDYFALQDVNNAEVNSPNEMIKNVYWGYLESGQASGLYGVFPQYLARPKDTGFIFRPEYLFLQYPSIGISDNKYDILGDYPEAFFRFSMKNGVDNTNPTNEKDPNITESKVSDRDNPFGFKEEDVLPEKITTFKDTSDKIIHSDIYRVEEKNDDYTMVGKSSDIAEVYPNEKINLALNIGKEASILKRYVCGRTLDLTRVGGNNEEQNKYFYNHTTGKYDAQIVWTLDLPSELNTEDLSAEIVGEGKDLFVVVLDLKTKFIDKNEHKIAIIKLNLKKDYKDEQYWKDIIEKFMKSKSGKLYLEPRIIIKGLSVKSDIDKDKREKDINIKATNSGYLAWEINSRKTDEDPDPSDTTSTYLYYLSRQDNNGRDDGMKDKPNLISYSVRVNFKIVSFSDGKKIYKEVRVKKGDNIASLSIDKKETMPKNPERSGYEFKEWNTKPDGSGEKFTDLSTVNDDITVYPVWEKIKNDRKKSSGTKTYTNKDTDTNKQEPSKDPDRLSGNNRVSTAVEVSRRMYSHANAVIIANKDKFSDVLTAVPFASQIKAPILFTDSDKLPEETKAEIQRLNPSIVYINGGKMSVSEAIEKDLKNDARNVYRFNGKDRYDTAKLIGDEVRERGSKNIVEIASGELFPDALSISSLAVKENAPILLSTKNDLTEKTKEALSSWKINKATIAGQTNTLSKKIEDNVRYGFNEKNVFAGTKNTLRLGGADRYETSAIIAKYALPDSNLGVYASGELFADSLIAGPYAAINNAPVLLLQRSNIPKSIEKHTVESKIEKATVIGGTRTVSENVYNTLMNILKAKQK